MPNVIKCFWNVQESYTASPISNVLKNSWLVDRSWSPVMNPYWFREIILFSVRNVIILS